MSIKTKFIAIGASSVVGIAVIIGLQQYTTNEIVKLEKSQIIAEKASANLLTLRGHEKDFLSRNDPAYKEKFDKEFETLMGNIKQIGIVFQDLGGEPEKIETLLKQAQGYKEQFANIVELQKRIGLDENSGLRGDAKSTASEIDELLKSANNDRLRLQFVELRLAESEFLLTPKAEYATKYSSVFAEFHQSLQNSRLSADSKNAIQTLAESYNETVRHLVGDYTKKGFKSDQGMVGGMRDNIHGIEKTTLEIEKNFENAVESRLSNTTWLLLMMTLMVVGIIVGILFLMSKRIISSVTKLSTAMMESSRNKDLSVRVTHLGNDELAQIGDAFNSMASEFESIIHQITHTSSSLSQSAHQLSSITEKTNAGVLRQHNESDQAATAMNEMTATVQEVAKHAANAAQASDTANGEAVKGKNIVAETTAGIQQLASEVQNTANAISELEKESANIGTVLNVIQGIAEQTNLLALNAAIEAARAGESGRGFAVVADEVRSLAQRSQVSTQEIKSIIERLQSVARDAVLAMQSGLKQTQTTVTQAQSAGQSLDAIAEAVMRINEMNTQIAAAAEEQTSVAEEINKNVNSIAHISDETAGLAQETMDTSSRLASFVAELQQVVGRFKLSDGNQSLDLSKAKAAHLAWKTRLRNFLDGQSTLTAQEAVSHQHCVLGKWYYGEGLAKFGHIQEMKDVEAPHTEMHGLIKQIVELKQSNNTREAEAIYKRVGPLSERIVALLEKVEQKVALEMQRRAS